MPHSATVANIYNPPSLNLFTTSGALEKLEMEMIELLNLRHGQPLCIVSLPTLYDERYGKGLQAEGYLTESRPRAPRREDNEEMIERIYILNDDINLGW
jgi:hypothetical protein